MEFTYAAAHLTCSLYTAMNDIRVCGCIVRLKQPIQLIKEARQVCVAKSTYSLCVYDATHYLMFSLNAKVCPRANVACMLLSLHNDTSG